MTNNERRHAGAEEFRQPVTTLPISDKQVIAIKMAQRRGKILAVEHPEIADKYRAGASHRQLADEYREEILAKYPNLSPYTVVSTIAYAIESLIDPEERADLGEEHGKQAGQHARDNNLGFFSMTRDERNKARRRGVQTQREKKVGIYGSEASTKHELGIRTAIKQGKTPISEVEREYILQLCNDPSFQHRTGVGKGMPDYNLIFSEMNRKFGTNRTKTAFQILGSQVKRFSNKEDK